MRHPTDDYYKGTTNSHKSSLEYNKPDDKGDIPNSYHGYRGAKEEEIERKNKRQ